ncbi:MAG: hypothetical protein QOE53_678 [Pseudonocardiales bacterium]|nr:hypothetical protein [Pseudonocardiales bacterium]
MVSREKQLKRLKKDAQKLWVDQQGLLLRANTVAHDALPQAQYYARERLVPGAAALYADRFGPYAQRGSHAARLAATTTRQAVIGTVVPAVTSAVSAAIALAEQAGSRLGVAGPVTLAATGAAKGKADKGTKSAQRKQLLAALKLAAAAKAASAAGRAAKSRPVKRSGPGAGGIVGIVFGVLVAGGIAYAVWQTLRADDDLWVADDEPEITPTGDAPTV